MSPLQNLSQPQTKKDLIAQKLADVRSLMRNHQLDGYLIPAVDEHLNLSLPEALQRRAWLSGFNGSAGDLLLLHDTAWLFVDSRYHEQASLEVDPSLIRVSKLGFDGHLSLLETLENLGKQSSFHLGFDPFTLSVEQFHEFLNRLLPAGVQLLLVADNLVDIVRSQKPWVDLEPRAAYGHSQLFHLPNTLTGETTEQKLARVREAMQMLKTDILPITNLNQVAWLFNLRGEDIPYIPLFIAYAIVTPDEAFLFTNLERIPTEIQQALASHVTLKPYQLYQETLKDLASQPNNPRVILDAKHTTTGTYQILLTEQSDDGKDGVQIALTANPIEGMKARKNEAEIEQMKLANLKASRAKVRTLKWISEKLADRELNELDISVTIEQFYRQEADFHSLSFSTIAATGPNSSIVHYKTPNPKEALKPGKLLLLDSGAQYLAGTTDDTRTMIVGEPTQLQIERYTTVLIAHINCAMQKFPKGTTGIQLDAIARSALWLLGLDYGHGTGHGVGAFLSGHEGPNGISKYVQEPLEPGMVVSIEPGFYESGWGGIRIENLYVVKDSSPENGSAWYEFESLTYIPFDKKLIDLNRLSPQQCEWLEQYNQAVIEKLAPTIDSTEAQWLKEACSFNAEE